MKVCSKCGEEKLNSGFPKYPNGKLRPACRDCANEMTKRWMAEGPKANLIVLTDPAAVWATRRMACESSSSAHEMA